MIPKKIHYCWFGLKPYPKLVGKCMKTWQQHLPDYEICLWNEENSPMDHPFVQQAYAAKKYAFVADYVRFWALYHHGGIYLDTDMYVLKSFDDLLNYDCFLGYEDHQQQYINCAIVGAEIHHSVIKSILNKYDTLFFNPNRLSDFIVPRLITPLVTDAVILPYDYFYPLPYHERFTLQWKSYITNKTYAVHLWNISWGKNVGRLRDFLLFQCKKMLFVK